MAGEGASGPLPCTLTRLWQQVHQLEGLLHLLLPLPLLLLLLLGVELRLGLFGRDGRGGLHRDRSAVAAAAVHCSYCDGRGAVAKAVHAPHVFAAALLLAEGGALLLLGAATVRMVWSSGRARATIWRRAAKSVARMMAVHSRR